MSSEYFHNEEMWRWAFGVFLALVALSGLYLSAHTAGGGFYLHGIGLFALCTAGIFRLIGQSFDESPCHHTP